MHDWEKEYRWTGKRSLRKGPALKDNYWKGQLKVWESCWETLSGAFQSIQLWGSEVGMRKGTLEGRWTIASLSTSSFDNSSFKLTGTPVLMCGQCQGSVESVGEFLWSSVCLGALPTCLSLTTWTGTSGHFVWDVLSSLPGKDYIWMRC